MNGPPPRPGPPGPPNPPPKRPGPSNRGDGSGTVEGVDVEPDAVTLASLGGVAPDDVAAWASAVAPTATPAAAPSPTASFTARPPRRRGGCASGRGHVGTGDGEGLSGMSSIALDLRDDFLGAVAGRTVRPDPVVKLWIRLISLNKAGGLVRTPSGDQAPSEERTPPAMRDHLDTAPPTAPSLHTRFPGGAARRLFVAVVALAAVTFAAALSSASVASGATATVGVGTTSNFGPVLTNAAGFALYTFPQDVNGMSKCTGACASVWPALTVPAGTTPTAGSGVTGTVAAVLQANGTYQVTYNGSPLYTFVGDTAAGQVTGNGVGGFAIVKVAAAPPPTTT